MKWKHYKTQTVMDGLVIRHELECGYANKPEISASREGVCISGTWPRLSAVGVAAVTQQLDAAVLEVRKLADGDEFKHIPDGQLFGS